jgi:hypothetical protein
MYSLTEAVYAASGGEYNPKGFNAADVANEPPLIFMLGMVVDNRMDTIAILIGLALVIFLIKLWVEKIERKRLAPYNDAFVKFFGESKLTCPKHKNYPEATLFRHVWRRAVVIEDHLAETEEEKNVLRKIQEISAKNYYACAPTNAYGKVKLQITPNQILEYLKREQSKPKDHSRWDSKKFACISLGITKDRKIYIGKTAKEPERRWVQHREMGTGPYKNGADYAEWKIIRGNLPLKNLDNWKSYYIGYYNTYEEGYNASPGNDTNAYAEGKNDSQHKIGIRKEDG